MSQAFNIRAKELLARMTLEEKLGQVSQGFFYLKSEEHELRVKAGHFGSILGITNAADSNRYQRWAVQESRLGIPLLMGNDIIHGHQTIFPLPLAESCSWDLDLMQRTARAAAVEATASGTRWTFAPMVDVGRDQRWGRVVEGAGEDPTLGALVAAARVRGFQGEDLSRSDALLACAKHFACYGAAEGGLDYAGVEVSDTTLHNVYLPPFKAALDAGVATFMSAFCDINGVPATANAYLLDEVLRRQWGFQGFVVSDWYSVRELILHGYAANGAEAAEKALLAGLDMDMVSGHFFDELAAGFQSGKLEIATLDQAVLRILTLKFKLGLFENAFVDESAEAAAMLRPEHLALAHEAALKSIVLLKNEGQVLPLAATVQRVALVGPFAQVQKDHLGCWAASSKPDTVVSIAEGLRAALAPSVALQVVLGCQAVGGDNAGFAEALKVAAESDVIVAAMGEPADMSGEATSRTQLELPGLQLDLLKALRATGKPIVLLLCGGRPQAIPWEAKEIDAILAVWCLGHRAGQAIAEVVTGKAAPRGRLTMSFPVNAGQAPAYYGKRRSGRPPLGIQVTELRYLDSSLEPVYPFGHGLTYGQFEYSSLSTDKATMGKQDSLTISITLRNVGRRTGEELVQLYTADLAASLTRPAKELKDFVWVKLEPGESQQVVFHLPAQRLAFFNAKLESVVEAGTFKFWVGPSAAQGLEGQFDVLGS